jgi:hypothetical protein
MLCSGCHAVLGSAAAELTTEPLGGDHMIFRNASDKLLRDRTHERADVLPIITFFFCRPMANVADRDISRDADNIFPDKMGTGLFVWLPQEWKGMM